MSTKVTAAILARDATQFLAFKRAMGARYLSGESALKRFLNFVSEQYGEGPVPLNEAVIRWATRIGGRKPVTVVGADVNPLLFAGEVADLDAGVDLR